VEKTHNEELHDQMLLGQSNQVGEMGGACSSFGERSAYTGFYWENLRTKALLEGITVEWRIIFKWIFRNWNGAWTRLIWLSVRTGNGLL
jgi:hypothetical protein